jgi:hypothetical protein
VDCKFLNFRVKIEKSLKLHRLKLNFPPKKKIIISGEKSSVVPFTILNLLMRHPSFFKDNAILMPRGHVFVYIYILSSQLLAYEGIDA